VPEAYIAVMKNRQKVVNTSEVYLDNKTEFQLEFFNPTSQTVLANIFINGNSISNRGLVLKPGQRVWLDRYLDDNRKFLYETYEVAGNSKEVKQAIANNGIIRIEFHPEKIKAPSYYNGTLTINSTGCWPYTNPTFTSCGNTNISSSSSNTAFYKGDIGSVSNTTSCYSSPTSGQTLDCDMSFMDQELSRGFSKSFKKEKSVETGRVEKGSVSNQSFETVNTEFEWYTNAVVEYKILPLSTKNVEAGELNRYCSNCGSKRKENYKFCPTCGNRF